MLCRAIGPLGAFSLPMQANWIGNRFGVKDLPELLPRIKAHAAEFAGKA